MKQMSKLVVTLFIAIASTLSAQEKIIAIQAGKLIDGKSDAIQTGMTILIQGNRIAEVGKNVKIPNGAQTINLSNATVLPGLIDAHTHVLLQGDVTQAEYDEQIYKESIPYRTIRAVAAVRDVETEGAMYADIDVKKAINNGVIPRPRMWISTRAMAPTGAW